MEPVRPLRDVFDGLANRPAGTPGGPGDLGDPGDPAAVLDGAGHSDLPDDLVAEALVSYAATAPPQVAEQLGPFVTAHSGVPGPDVDPPAELPDPAEGLALLDGAGDVGGWDDPLDLDAAGADLLDVPAPVESDHVDPDHADAGATDHLDPWTDHGFGSGAGPEADDTGTWQDLDDDGGLGSGLGSGHGPGPVVEDGWLSLDLDPQPQDAGPATGEDPSDPATGLDHPGSTGHDDHADPADPADHEGFDALDG